MPKLRKVDASVMTTPRKRTTSGRAVSPEQDYLVRKIKTITSDDVVYEVTLSGDEKPLTVRQQLLRAAKLADVEIAVRKSDKGFYVGLMNPERRSRRGRRRASA
jgi:hypothetical protein